LLSGIKVNKYLYVDIDPLARDIAKFRVANLSARFPDLFPPTAWENAFDLPQDINAVRDYHLDQHLANKSQQILLVAGWPCQEYSPAGRGIPGPRAAILDKIISILVRLQALQPGHPIAYLLENIAIQDNFIHAHIRNEVAAEVESKIGKAVTFDAANVGSYATRIRNYWTNLAGHHPAQMVYDKLRCGHKGTVYDVLGEGRHPMPVEKTSKGGHNVAGEIRAVLPTFMSYRNSRAFRPMQAGSIYSTAQRKFLEPTAVERELAMGYEPGSTAAPEVDDGERCQALGQAIDLNALYSLVQVTQQLHNQGLSHVGASARVPTSRVRKTVMAFRYAPCHEEVGHGDHDTDSHLIKSQVVAFVGGVPTDLYDDEELVQYLRQKELPASAEDSKRVLRRAKAYRFYNGRFFKVIDRSGEPLSYRLVPEPHLRDALILDAHENLGHLGEKRSISAISATYWWYGMTLDIKRVIAGCKQCQRVKASGGHKQRDMQTESPENFGMFHRWGLDHIVDLPTSANGFRHALVCIDYYSKWVEVIPVKDLTANTTVHAFLLNVIARFGAPAEIITDNGSAFKQEFRDFCRRRLIHQRFITEDVPRSNGLAERAVQTVKHALRKFAAQKHHALDWDTNGLAAILSGYRLTPQAASRHSPARIIFALDPTIDAAQHIQRMGRIDYDEPDPDKLDAELWKRVKYVQELGVQVAHNLRTAHERDCRRFKARRSGLYIPKIHHFIPGDYVWVLSQGQKPGGTLGVRARPEVLRVQEVRDTGVLVLVNQAGQIIEKHMEHCSPCALPNLMGDTYAGLARPPEDLPCQVCKDHRHWDLMLLCDNCDSGWHTFCLSPPLDHVPEGDWLCPDCETHGVTLEELAAKRSRYKPDERSRPALELPARSRQAKANALATEWHNAIVKHKHHKRYRFGRVSFQGVLSPQWFRIDWQDGSTSEHMARIFSNVERIAESEAPYDVPSPVEPAVVAAMSRRDAPPKSDDQYAFWCKAQVEELGLTHEDWTSLYRLFDMDNIGSLMSPYMSTDSADGRRARSRKGRTCGESTRALIDAGGSFVRVPVECEPIRQELHKLLAAARAEVIFVPPEPERFLLVAELATAYATALVCAKISPEIENLIWRGQLFTGWFTHFQEHNRVLIHHVNHKAQNRTTTWLYVFPRGRKKACLKVDIPDTCTYICSDYETGNITSVL
jgi:transposase InsO family protein